MPRLTELTFWSAVWILVLFFLLAVTENKTHAEQNTSLLNPGEHTLAHDCSGISWKQRLFPENKSLGTVASRSLNKILQLKAAKITDLERRHRNTSTNRTLIDFSGPVITEDLDDTSNQDLVDHVRIKRSKPVYRQSNFVKLLDSFPRPFQTDATSTFDDSTSERSYSNIENQFDIIVNNVTPHSRLKRKVLLKNKYLKKRTKGNAGHSKNRVGIRKQRKHDTWASSHQSAKNQSSNSKSRRGNKNIQEIGIIAKTVEESRIGKREAMENDANMENKKYNITNEISVDLDEKLRVKRNQKITSKCNLQNKNTKDSKHLKNPVKQASINNTRRDKVKYEKTRGNRAVKSIEEIKNLAEKLIIKINELQVYINNRNKTLNARNSSKDARSASSQKALNGEPRNSLKKKNVSSSAFKIAKINNHQRFAKQASLADKRTSQIHSGNSTLLQGEYQTGKRSHRKWGRWMDWSSCSVTCGKGRQIRWRHCLHDCNDAETEMEEKACQLPACPPNKFLGIF